MADSPIPKTSESLTFRRRNPILVEALNKTYHFSKTQLLMNTLLTVAAIPISQHYGLLTAIQSWTTLKVVLSIYGALLVLTALWNFVSVPLRRLESLARAVNDIEARPALTEPRVVSTRDIEQVMERFMEQFYDLKKLKPSFLQSTPENVSAHDDPNGIIVKGSATSGETFRALVLPYSNNSHKEKVAPLERVSLRIDYVCFKGDQNSILVIPRGAWLSEKETEVDFPPGCPPRDAIISTVEGETNIVYAIRRDDSAYKGVITTREELRGTVFGVHVELLAPSHIGVVKKFVYILEIIREPSFEVRLTKAALWKAGHLSEFSREGFAFSRRLHEIWEDANNQVPIPETKPYDLQAALRGDAPEKLDYFDFVARRRAIEREQEEKLLDAIKDWQARAADFVGLYISAEQRDKFVNSVPSIEDGFNRAEKSNVRFRIARLSAKQKESSLSYWMLSDAVSSRTDKLLEITNQLL